jgi:hypothetical protein
MCICVNICISHRIRFIRNLVFGSSLFGLVLSERLSTSKKKEKEKRNSFEFRNSKEKDKESNGPRQQGCERRGGRSNGTTGRPR